jgi:hypothetical protein
MGWQWFGILANHVFDVSTSRHFQIIDRTSLVDTTNKDILSVRLHIENLTHRKIQIHLSKYDPTVIWFSIRVDCHCQSKELVPLGNIIM